MIAYRGADGLREVQCYTERSLLPHSLLALSATRFAPTMKESHHRRNAISQECKVDACLRL
jgi:hypothetical protein